MYCSMSRAMVKQINLTHYVHAKYSFQFPWHTNVSIKSTKWMHLISKVHAPHKANTLMLSLSLNSKWNYYVFSFVEFCVCTILFIQLGIFRLNCRISMSMYSLWWHKNFWKIKWENFWHSINLLTWCCFCFISFYVADDVIISLSSKSDVEIFRVLPKTHIHTIHVVVVARIRIQSLLHIHLHTSPSGQSFTDGAQKQTRHGEN